MVRKTVIKEIVQIHKARMEEEELGTVRYSEDTVRVKSGNIGPPCGGGGVGGVGGSGGSGGDGGGGGGDGGGGGCGGGGWWWWCRR